MEFEFYFYLIFLVTGLVAGFIDAVAGGGGIITIPVLLASGIPPHIALATNKLQGTFGSGMASYNFISKGFISWKEVSLGVFYTFIGAAIGTYAILLIDASMLSKIIPIMLVGIFLYTLFSPKMGANDKHALLGSHLFFFIFGLALGFYDGFFGPGTGSFFVFLFVRLLGYDFLNASASAKLLNVATNVAAIILFSLKGHVWWHFALPLAVANVLGSVLGTHMALKHGTGFVRGIFIAVVSLLILKTGYDAFLR